MLKKQELAMCGCCCDLCKAYAPNVEKNDQRKILAEMWNKYYGLDPSVMDSCEGCRNNPSDEDCPVRKCVLEKDLNHCGDCSDFPCEVFYQRCGSFSEEKKKDFDMDEYNEYILAYDNETRLNEYKTKQAQLKKVSVEIMRFMRGKYALDEVGNGKDELAFLDGDKIVLTIHIRNEHYYFVIGKEVIQVDNLNALEKIKEIIIASKIPNRKPFTKDYIYISNCGHRCDLCVHYKGETSVSADERDFVLECHKAVYGDYAWEKNCNGCHFPDCTVESAHCRKGKDIDKCWTCENYSTCLKTAGWPPEIHTRTITADQVTWAILPYVKGQYGN